MQYLSVLNADLGQPIHIFEFLKVKKRKERFTRGGELGYKINIISTVAEIGDVYLKYRCAYTHIMIFIIILL